MNHIVKIEKYGYQTRLYLQIGGGKKHTKTFWRKIIIFFTVLILLLSMSTTAFAGSNSTSVTIVAYVCTSNVSVDYTTVSGSMNANYKSGAILQETKGKVTGSGFSPVGTFLGGYNSGDVYGSSTYVTASASASYPNSLYGHPEKVTGRAYFCDIESGTLNAYFYIP